MSEQKKGLFDKLTDALTDRDEKAAVAAAQKQAADAASKAENALKQAADLAAKAGSEEARRKAAEAQAALAKAKAEAEARAKELAQADASTARKLVAESDARVKDLESKLKSLLDEEKAEEQAKQAAIAAEAAAKAAALKHTVAAGETLSHISLKYYKSANRWKEIYEANKDVIGDNPNRIKPGQELVIPGTSQG
jgi:nucleoid-associated protein YgaU